MECKEYPFGPMLSALYKHESFYCKNHSYALCDLKEVQISSRHYKREMIKAQSTMVFSTIKWSHWQDELDHKLKVDNRVGDNCAMQMTT
jgi:hypothetical protein